MKLYRPWILLLLALMAGNAKIVSAPIQPFQECNQVEVKVETTNASGDTDNGSVTITIVRGSANGARFIFCERSGKVLNQENLNSNKVDNLKKGEYFCVVSTRECSKKVNFTIN